MAISFTNQATLSYNGIQTTSNITRGRITEVLAATKAAVLPTYGPNDTVTYVLSLINSGTSDFTELTLTDSLGAYAFGTGSLYPLDYVAGSIRYYENGALQTAPIVTVGPPMSIENLRVPAGGNAILIYEARTNAYAPLDTAGIIDNEAIISGGGLSAPLRATERIETADEPILTISKTLSPDTVTENSRLTYSFIIQNNGNTEAAEADNVQIIDHLDPVLSDLTVVFNGIPWSAPTHYTYTADGRFETVEHQITVPAATYSQDIADGHWITTPGISILTVTGTV